MANDLKFPLSFLPFFAMRLKKYFESISKRIAKEAKRKGRETYRTFQPIITHLIIETQIVTQWQMDN